MIQLLAYSFVYEDSSTGAVFEKPSQKWRMDSCGTEVSDKASSCVYTFSGIVAEQLAYMLRSSELPDKPPRSYLGPRDPGTPRSLAHTEMVGTQVGSLKASP